MTDRELLQRVRRGDIEAWGKLFDRYFLFTWRLAVSLTHGDQSLADDVTSETMLTLANRAQSLDLKRDSFAHLIHGVVRHKVADAYRRERRHERKNQLFATDQGDYSADDQASQLLEAGETREQVHLALEQLSPDERLVLEWKYKDELSVRDIAARLERSESSIQSLLYRARQTFRKTFRRLDAAQTAGGQADE